MPLNSDAAQTFIEVEVSSAELFTRLALEAREGVDRERHLQNALKAYQTARHFLPSIDFSTTKRDGFERRLADVQFRLEGLAKDRA
jgi:hypothetical protein